MNRISTWRRFGAALFVACLGASVVLTAPTVSIAAPTVSLSADGELSDAGSEAVADLRSCLASKNTLNVYYLVDSSLSLERSDGGAAGTGSDPAFMRASVLANSLAQLGSIREGLQLNWAAGFFSTEYESALGWSAWTADSPEKLRKTIEAKTPGGYTNWTSALKGAQRALADQQSAAPGCQVLVWLTDGQIDMQAPDGQQQEDFDALNQLCGAPLHPQGQPATGFGSFDSLRQSGVVVIGALLSVDALADSATDDMRALVEGQSDGAATTCGISPIPEGYTHGAFVKATGPDSLARVFLGVNAQLAGGYPRPFNEDGSFWIDPGVARFRIILAGEWTLTPPSEVASSPASNAQQAQWATVTETDGATIIEVNTSQSSASGLWQLTANDTRSLFLFSDLHIQFEDRNEIEVSADGSAAATLSAQVIDAAAQPYATSVFGDHDFNAWYIDASGARAPLDGAVLDDETGHISIPLPPDLTLAQITVTASIDPLVTDPNDLELAPITTEQTVTTVLPAEFPRIAANPVALSTLEGADGTAVGALELIGPTAAGAAQVCIDRDPQVVSDSGHREDWQWTLGDGTDGAQCVSLEPGSTGSIALAVTNSEAADSVVRGSIPVTFVSSTGNEIRQDVAFEFRSTHPISVAAVGGTFLLLLAIGTLLPLLVATGLKWLATRIQVQPETQRASFPITVTDRTATVHAPSVDSALANAFAYVPNNTKGVKSHSYAALGKCGVRIGFWPWTSPKFEIVPPSGMRIAYIQQGKNTPHVDPGHTTLLLPQLPFDRFAAVLVPQSQLESTDEISGTIVIYHGASNGNETLASRIAELQSRSPDIAQSVTRLRDRAIDDRRAREASSSKKATAKRGDTPQGAALRISEGTGRDMPPALPGDNGTASTHASRRPSGPPPLDSQHGSASGAESAARDAISRTKAPPPPLP